MAARPKVVSRAAALPGVVPDGTTFYVERWVELTAPEAPG
jgi:hypothetical protein